MTSPDFSIIIPTYNGEQTIGKLLKSLILYSGETSIEILIFDSSSTDHTPEIVRQFQKKHPAIFLFTFPKSHFNHGETRNWGVRKARGRYVLFISQDALPLTPHMFKLFREGLSKKKRMVAVFCRQIPLSESPIIQQIESTRDFEKLAKYSRNSLLVFDKSRPFIPYTNDNFFLWYFLSNVCACYKRSFLLKHPFKKIRHGEDVLMGKNIIENGYCKGYDPCIVVRHSHSYNFVQYFQREFEDMFFYSSVLKLSKKVNIHHKIRQIISYRAPWQKKAISLLELPVYYAIKLLILVRIRYTG